MNNDIINDLILKPENKKRLDDYFKERRTTILKEQNNKIKK